MTVMILAGNSIIKSKTATREAGDVSTCLNPALIFKSKAKSGTLNECWRALTGTVQYGGAARFAEGWHKSSQRRSQNVFVVRNGQNVIQDSILAPPPQPQFTAYPAHQRRG